jgi:pimeloyl-ACP methyl ester carboxylesterase
LKIKNQTVLAAIILSGIILVNSNNFSSLVAAYSQGQNINSTSFSSSSFQSKAAMIDNMPSQKVTVGDINMAYKQLNKGGAKPMILITGLGATMDMWNPLLLEQLLSSNHTVIIFDNRGAGESTAGTKEFSISQFTNDTAGLLEALKIEKADVLGWSMGSFIAQELALTNPDKINSLILYASGCGGQDAEPPSPEVIQTFTNISSITPQELGQKLISLLFPTDWFKANPNYLNYFPIPKESVSPEIMGKQSEAIANWTGTCNAITKITQPTLIIVGTDDAFTPALNSLMLVERIPSPWLVQIKNAGHGLMYQFPDEFNRILMTFLEYNS